MIPVFRNDDSQLAPVPGMAQPLSEGAVKFSIPPNQVGKRIMWSLVPDFFHANELCLNVFIGLGDREH